MMDTAKNLCSRTADYFNCRMMPHGGPVLFPVVLTTLGLCAILADDGCDYARLRGAAVEMLTGSAVVPYIDCGLSAYRIPGFYPAENSWRVVYSEECMPYENMNLLADTSWVAAEWLRFLSLVVGGATTMFLWTSICLTLRPNYWQAAGIGAGLACLFQMCSFVWFYTKLCHTSTTDFINFEAGREVEGNPQMNVTSSCDLFFGSKCSITSSVLWAVASAVMLLRKYPAPVPKFIVQEENVAIMAAAPSKRTGRRRRKKGVDKSTRSSVELSTPQASTRSLGLQQSTRSLQWVSGAPTTAGGHDPNLRGSLRSNTGVPPIAGGHDHNHRGSLRSSVRSNLRPAGGDETNNGSNRPVSSIRPKELSGSAFSAVSFV